MPLHCLDQFQGGRLTGTDNIEHRIITIRCSRDANKISGNSFYVLSVLGLNSIGRFLLDEGLVDPEYVTEHYSVLIVFQRLKDLFIQYRPVERTFLLSREDMLRLSY